MTIVQCTITQIFEDFASSEKVFSSMHQNRTQRTSGGRLCEKTHIAFEHAVRSDLSLSAWQAR
jgi:hypothetical protein